jgi:pre-mRNA-splicing factor 18
MDALKAEIAKKRQLLQAAVSNSNGSTAEDQQPAFKYVKRSALDEVSRQRNISTKPAASSTDAASINEPADQIKKRSAKGDQTLVDGTESDQDDEKYKNIPDEELRRRFRAFGEPVRLFGETHKQRVRRLKALEMNQEQTDGQRNVFMSHVSQVDSELQMQDLLKQSMHSTAGINSVPGNGASETASGKASEDQRSKKEQVFAKYETEFELIDMKLAQQDKNRCCELIYVFLKKLLHEWGEQLDRRPDDVKRTAKGKSDTITHRQTQDYMKPLFRMLKGKTVEIDVLAHVANICELAFHREYIKANEV